MMFNVVRQWLMIIDDVYERVMNGLSGIFQLAMFNNTGGFPK